MSGGDWKLMLTAAQDGNIELVRYYLDAGIDPNYQHPELLTTPLIESIAAQHTEVVQYLLEQGADPQLKAGFSQDSPLSVAKEGSNPEITALIQTYLPKEQKSFWQLIQKIIIRLLRPIVKRYGI